MRFLIVCLALISYSSVSFSETVSSSLDSLNGDFSFSEGNLLSAKLKTDVGQTDNFLRSHDNEQATSFIALSPEVFVQTQGAGSLFQLQAKASYFSFDKFSNDNHTDYSVLSKYHLRFAESQKIFLTGYIADTYEYRGTGLSLGEADTLEEGDVRRNKFINVGYLYGHENSLAKAKVLFGYRDFSYTTRESITKPLAYTSNYVQGNFDYLITGNTYFSTKLQYENYGYDMNADLEREQYLTLAGIKWRSTQQTQLNVLLGYEKNAFTNEAFEDEDKFTWQVKMLWNPIARIQFDFSSGSEVKDSYKTIKSVNLSDYYYLGLRYDLNEKLQFKFNVKIVNEDVISLESRINEDHFETKAQLEYQWRYWLSVFAQYNYNTFDSTNVLQDYDLQAGSVGVEIAF
jgi:hypothetical protein